MRTISEKYLYRWLYIPSVQVQRHDTIRVHTSQVSNTTMQPGTQKSYFLIEKIAKNVLHSHEQEQDKLSEHCERVQRSLSAQTLRFVQVQV